MNRYDVIKVMNQHENKAIWSGKEPATLLVCSVITGRGLPEVATYKV